MIGLRPPFCFVYRSYYRSHLFFFLLIPAIFDGFTLCFVFVSLLTLLILIIRSLSPLLPVVGLSNSLFLTKSYRDVHVLDSRF